LVCVDDHMSGRLIRSVGLATLSYRDLPER
jgi:hypothetical protein